MDKTGFMMFRERERPEIRILLCPRGWKNKGICLIRNASFGLINQFTVSQFIFVVSLKNQGAGEEGGKTTAKMYLFQDKVGFEKRNSAENFFCFLPTLFNI